MVVGLMALMGWRGSFVILGIASCVWVIFWYFLFRDNPADHPRISQAELSELPPYVNTATKLSRVPWKSLVLRMLPVAFVYFCYGWTLWLYLSWLPQYFKNRYSLELNDHRTDVGNTDGYRSALCGLCQWDYELRLRAGCDTLACNLRVYHRPNSKLGTSIYW